MVLSLIDVQNREIITIGFGPAGLAVVQQAHAKGLGVEAIDPTNEIGGGLLGDVSLTSNSPGADFTEPYVDCNPRALTLAEAQPLIGTTVPVKLKLACSFLHSVAKCAVNDGWVSHTKEKALGVVQTPNGYLVNTLKQNFITPRLFLTLGAKEELLPELSNRDASITYKAGEIFSHYRDEELATALKENPHVIIIGNSHGAYSVVGKLLKAFPNIRIDMLKRSDTKPFFESVDEAKSFRYQVTAKDSICPDTGRINRYDGIRGKARDLWYRETQDNLDHRLYSHTDTTLNALDLSGKAILVQAIGFERNNVPFSRLDGSELKYRTIPTPQGFAQAVEIGGDPLPGVTAIGLGSSEKIGTNVFHEQAKDALEVPLPNPLPELLAI